MKPVLVKTIVDKKLGRVLTTGSKQAIYVWNREPKGTIRCTGACAKAWPPVLVKKGVVVPMHVKGIKGDFGTIRRANGVRQLTFNKPPALHLRAREAQPGALQRRRRLVRRQGSRVTRETPRETPLLRAYGRRTFLAATGIGLSSLLWGRPVWQAVSGAAQPLQGALPSGLVPSSGWRIYTVAATMPRFDRSTWRLRIEGLVEQPVTLTYEELRRLPRAEQVSDFHCVTGWSVHDVHWAGVRFRDLLAAAGLRRGRACSRSSRRSGRTSTP